MLCPRVWLPSVTTQHYDHTTDPAPYAAPFIPETKSILGSLSVFQVFTKM